MPSAADRKPAAAATAAKALSVLDHIGHSGEAPRFKDLAERTGLPKPTLHRMLSALLDFGLVRYRPSDQAYVLGHKVLELASRMRSEADIRTAAGAELLRLSQVTGEVAHLALLDGLQVVYADEQRAPQAIRAHYGAEKRLPLHCSAVGKALLAFLDPAQRDDVVGRLDLTRYTSATLTDASALRAELHLVKARGYAIDNEEHEAGTCCVAAPILDSQGEALAAIGVTGPAFRLPVDRRHELGSEVMAAATLVSERLRSSLPQRQRVRRMGSGIEQARCVLPATAFLGDSPVWDAAAQVLLWVDMLAPSLHRFDPRTGRDASLPLSTLVSCVALRERGGLIATTQNGFAFLDQATGTLTPLREVEQDRPNNRFNDGKCDRQGRFWAGTMSMVGEPAAAALYRLGHDLGVQKMEDRIGTTNGIAWSPDDRLMYFTETVRRTIYVYDFDPDCGRISNRRVFAQVPEQRGVPGGLTVDSDGFVWSANWDGWCVTRYDPNGQVERVVPLPVPRPTSCMFGGADLETLFITSARIRLSSSQLAHAPLSGSVFAVPAPARGIAEPAFKG